MSNTQIPGSQIKDISVDTADIKDSAITNAKRADMAQGTISGRGAASGTGAPMDLTASQVLTILGGDTSMYLKLDNSNGPMTGTLNAPVVKKNSIEVIAFGDEIFNVDTFTPERQVPMLDFFNVLHRGDSRFTVTQTGFSTFTASALFDGAYEQSASNIIDAAGTAVATIDLITKSEYGASGIVYPQGYVYIHCYKSGSTWLPPASVSGRIKDKDGNWNNMTAAKAIGNTWRLSVPSNNYMVTMEITMVADGATSCRITELEYFQIRNAGSKWSIPNKYISESLYSTWAWRDATNVTQTAIGPGTSYFLQNLGVGTASPASRLHILGTSSVANVAAGAVEQLTADGTFVTDTGWTIGAGWTTGGSPAAHATGQTGILSGTSTATNTAVVYKVTFDVVASVAGDGFTVSLGGRVYPATFSTTASMVLYLLPVSGTGTLSFNPGAAGTFVGTIGNISIKPLTSAVADVTVMSSDGSSGPLQIRTGPANGLSTSIGYQAGESLLGTSLYNAFFGTYAGRFTVNGINNTAVGYTALSLNTVGKYNTAVGYTALYNNSGSSNTAIGSGASYYNSNGIENVSVGYIALGANTSSSGNTAIGSYSLNANLAGGNTGVGYASLIGLNNANAMYNSAVGYNAGRSLTTGNYNSFLGYAAGFHASQKVDATNVTVIGNAAYTTLSNTVILGNTSVIGVGIGTYTPGAHLDLDGIGDAIQLRVSGNSTQNYDIFQVTNSTPTTKLAVSKTGMVGIGHIDAGTNLLSVNNDLAANADLTVSNLVNIEGRITLEAGAGLYIHPNYQVGATKTNLYGIKFVPTIDNYASGDESTNFYGMYLDSNAGAAKATNAYGLYINTVSGTTNSYAIYTNTGPSYFGDTVEVNGILRQDRAGNSAQNIQLTGIVGGNYITSNSGLGSLKPLYIQNFAVDADTLTTNNSIIFQNGKVSTPSTRMTIDYLGNINIPGEIVSTLATGTAPLSVASTTLVTNLNADLLDGIESGNATGQIPVSNGTVNTNLNADMVDGKHIGTSGNTVPLLDGTNTFSGSNTFTGGLTVTTANITLTDKDVVLGTTTGTKFGTATNQKIAFYGSTPIVQQSSAIDLGVVLGNLGFRVSSAYYPITTGGAVQLTGGVTISTQSLTVTDTDIVLGTTTGTKIGTATTQKLGFYNSTPIIQPLATTDLGTVLSSLGLRASGTAYPITTSGAVQLTGGVTITTTDLTLTDENVILGTTTGTKFGTSTSQKLAFYNSTPIVQSSNLTDLGTVLSDLGLRAVGTSYPITTSGALVLTGTVSSSQQITSTVATGLSPFSIASTTLVSNLNVDMVDGKHVGSSGNTIPLLDGTNSFSGVNSFGDGAGNATVYVGKLNLVSTLAASVTTIDLVSNPITNGDSSLSFTTGHDVLGSFITSNLLMYSGGTRLGMYLQGMGLYLGSGFSTSTQYQNGTLTIDGQITSKLAIGTSPFAVASTTVNTNLNADMLDGKHTGTSGNTVPLLDGTNTFSALNTFTGGVTINTGNLTLTDKDIVLGTTTGTKIGTDPAQKLGFYNATPVIQQVATTDLGTALSNLGLRAAGTAYPITTSGAVQFTGGVTITTGNITLTDKDIVLSATTGTKFGTATTQKLAFYNSAPIAKPGAYTQTYSTADKTVAAQTAAAITNNTGGAVSTTFAAIGAGTTYLQADMTAIKNALASAADQINKLRSDHVDTLQALTALIDDLQALGLVG